ncbi:putative quinol monooxygenase [Lichenihabitans psoromatis]|uniref:putative quinol monooxygenase n=1 Tax=Lichenihabitans psoromatis TaxID=2528642 RepID=UPI001036A7F5|nr:antibiotic biosynthesis monooxygenase [Lichenihabitans psoromatis]
MKTMMVGLLAMTATCGLALPAHADDTKAGLYEVSEISILPNAMKSKKDNVPGMIEQMVKDTKGDEGLMSIKVTQQIGQLNNYTVVEQWKDQASLDKHIAADHTKQFSAKIEDMLSGPIYQRVFSVFQ